MGISLRKTLKLLLIFQITLRKRDELAFGMASIEHGAIRTPVAYRFFEAAPVPLNLPGDFNRNNELDVEDIDLLTAETLSETPDQDYDLNDDGSIDQDDRVCGSTT